jgi:hypothetical protein
VKAHGKRRPWGWGYKEKCLRHNIEVAFHGKCRECTKEERLKKGK